RPGPCTPARSQWRLVAHEQIIKPAMRIITGPLVQLGLDLQYPDLGPHQGRLQLVGVHRRPPDIPVPALLTCWPPSPCGRLSRPPWRVVTPATTNRVGGTHC